MSFEHDVARLVAGEHDEPHAILGPHPSAIGDVEGVVVRTLLTGASKVSGIAADGTEIEFTREVEGAAVLFGGFFPGADPADPYTLKITYPDGTVVTTDDPYRFWPTLGDVDLHLFNEGTHRRLWETLGAHVRTIDGVTGVSAAVWAPNARRVSFVGDFCNWDGRRYPMRRMGSSGVWEIFVPGVGEGALYKFEVLTRESAIRLKTDPFALKIEQYPGTAAIVQLENTYSWNDDAWIATRGTVDPVRSPMSIYEVHLGSWARTDDGRVLSYREIAGRLATHVRALGFTHVELLPIMEHPFYGSWGYQVSGYYAPTSRYGTPDDFRYFVDTMHEHGIGVIADWVPAHFPKDDYALRRFDGTALFEHEDPRLGEHPDWGTLIFNYARNEVRNFLVANALFWISEFHIDGLRVDAVASMLYLDYSRQPGEWLRNRFGGRENLDAIAFFEQLNASIEQEFPGAITIAEESTSWPAVSRPVADGGLGFTFKWNMGWMHDSLSYMAVDPLFRAHHQDQLTFGMLYEYNEHFIMPLSHDEVVHLKGSLLAKMPGDEWQKLANLRLLLAFMFTRPGKKLLFMGTELAPWTEWNHDTSLDWNLLHDPRRADLCRYVGKLGAIYKSTPALWRDDASWDGFCWIDVADKEGSVISYVRSTGEDRVVVLLHFTPVPRERYRIGVPQAGRYQLLISSDDGEWGGSGIRGVPYGESDSPGTIDADPIPYHGYQQSVEVTLPPLGALVLAPVSE